MIVQLSLLISLMIVAGLGPGMMLTRPLRLSPLERLCTSVGLSWIVIYLFATLVYLTGLNWHWCYLASFIFLIAFLRALPDMRRLLANHALRRTAIGLGLLTIWLLLLLALIRNYSGGMWSGDWLEHYQRTEFFLHRYPRQHLFIGIYLLPARPPMMNLLAAFFLAQVGKGFPAFELCFALLNLSAFLPAALLLNRLAPRGNRAIWLLVIALGSSPFFAENTTYAWTKLFCAFYVLLGTALYLRGKPILAFIMLAAGCLVHYSAGVFTIYLAGHYLWKSIRNRPNWRELGAIIVCSAVLLASWFGWAIWRFGLHATLASNTAVSGAAQLDVAQNISKVIRDIIATIVPPWITRVQPGWGNQSMLGWVRDQGFIWYQQNLLLMMGSAGAVVAVGIVWGMLVKKRSSAKSKQRQWFWLGMVAFCVPAAIATHGAAEVYGCGQVVLQPLVLIGIAAIAANARRLPGWAFSLLMAGWAVDFCLGICLQGYLENQTFYLVKSPDGRDMWSMPIRMALVALQNYQEKITNHVVFIGDYWPEASGALLVALIVWEIAALWWLPHARREWVG